MKKYYRLYKKSRKQKKYNEFKSSNSKLFTNRQVKIIKARIERVNANSVMMYGEYNAKRLSSYPCINNDITSKGICAYCEIETDVIHFDDDVSLCESCASEHNLI